MLRFMIFWTRYRTVQIQIWLVWGYEQVPAAEENHPKTVYNMFYQFCAMLFGLCRTLVMLRCLEGYIGSVAIKKLSIIGIALVC